MLRYFLNRRIRIYLDFVMNLVDVRDVAEGLVLAMEQGQIGHRYILGGENIRLKNLLELTAAISGRGNMLVPVPGRVAEVTAAALEFIADHVTRRPPAATVESVQIALRSKALSNEKSRSELGYAPRSVEPALRETIASFLGAVAPGVPSPAMPLIGTDH
jgi:dihydroflavonol-4-reductase